jgi:hypothetical protein
MKHISSFYMLRATKDVHVHAACPCPFCISMAMIHVQVNAVCPCPCFMSTAMPMLHVYVLAAMSVQHVHAANSFCLACCTGGPCCDLCFMSILYRHAACPSCGSMLHAHFAYLCCISMLHIHYLFCCLRCKIGFNISPTLVNCWGQHVVNAPNDIVLVILVVVRVLHTVVIALKACLSLWSTRP